MEIRRKPIREVAENVVISVGSLHAFFENETCGNEICSEIATF